MTILLPQWDSLRWKGSIFIFICAIGDIKAAWRLHKYITKRNYKQLWKTSSFHSSLRLCVVWNIGMTLDTLKCFLHKICSNITSIDRKIWCVRRVSRCKIQFLLNPFMFDVSPYFIQYQLGALGLWCWDVIYRKWCMDRSGEFFTHKREYYFSINVLHDRTIVTR